MDPVILATIGLVIAMFGTVLVFWFGVPPSKETWGYSQLLEKEVETKRWGRITHKEAMEKEQIWYDRCRFWSRVGLVMVFVGFLFQLWSLYPKILC